MPDPKGELGQIGPHADPNGDAAWLAAQAQAEAGSTTVTNTSYEGMSSNPPGEMTMHPYDEVKHSGIPC